MDMHCMCSLRNQYALENADVLLELNQNSGHSRMGWTSERLGSRYGSPVSDSSCPLTQVQSRGT